MDSVGNVGRPEQSLRGVVCRDPVLSREVEARHVFPRFSEAPRINAENIASIRATAAVVIPAGVAVNGVVICVLIRKDAFFTG